MGKLFYLLFIHAYGFVIRVAAYWNPKARLWVAGRKQFPSIDNTTPQKTVWMHCASLGEFEQGRPLLEAIKKQYPGTKIVLSFFSPSGYEVVTRSDSRKVGTGSPALTRVADHIIYLPMDSESNATKLIDTINPGLVIWIKYEFWYYYLTELKKRNVPLLMVAGLFRESQPFFKWYGDIWKKMLQGFTYFFVQNEESRDLLLSVGINKNVSLSEDTRFDRVIAIAEKFEPLPVIEQFCGNSKVMVAGSTWEEDEEELTHYVKSNPQIKFIIAPHEIHEGNIKDVKKEFPGAVLYSELVADDGRQTTDDRQKAKGKGQLATSEEPAESSPGEEVALPPFRGWGNGLIIDNIGMLSKLYHYAHITFVGGGFNEDGIHNVLEAAVYGKPVIFGPEYEKFAEAVDLVECGAGIPISNALELEKVLTELWNDEALLNEKSAAAKKYVYSKAGGTKKIMDYIQENRLLTS